MFVEDFDILCFTPQILVNNLDEKVIKSLSEFSLLILDECHHARGDDPYNNLMRKYLIEKAETKKEMPQVRNQYSVNIRLIAFACVVT